MIRSTLEDEMAAVAAMCTNFALGEVTLAVLKAAHHTTFLVMPLEIVARVQSSEPIDSAREMAITELAVAGHLASKSAPALAPLQKIAGPHVIGPCVVTLWPFVDQARPAEQEDASVAATSLKAVHRALRDYSGDLPDYTGALEHCWSVLGDDSACRGLSRSDRDLLKAQYRRLRSEADGRASHWVPLHGDPHLGNLLIGADGPVWLDFEDACVGPREYDIACLPVVTWPQFGNVNQALLKIYADLRNICIAVWCWDDVSRSDGAREAAHHNLERVRKFAV